MRTSKQRRKCIFVLGMHRSGTSAFAGSLRTIGLDLGDNLMPANTFNEKGYFEDLDVQRLNDEILQSYGRVWDSLYPFELAENDFHKKEIQALYLQKFEKSRVAVIKDPRISLLFPIWKAALKELNVRSYAVIMLRNPIEVAGSLKRRDRFSLTKSLLLWARHTISAEQYTRNVDRLIVPHENFLENPTRYIRGLKTLISSDVKVTRHAVKEVEDFIDLSLQHHKSGKEVPEVFQWVSDLWTGLKAQKPNLSVSREALSKFKKTVELYYPEDISRTLSADTDFPQSTLHIDTGSGFDGLQKVRVPFNCNRNLFCVNFREIGKFKNMRAVRWDPTESDFIKLHLDSIQAVDSEGNQVEINKSQLKSNGATSLDRPVEFHTTDPWIEIPLSLPVTEITISGKIWPLDTRNLFRNLGSQLSQARKEAQAADSAKGQLSQEKNEWFKETKGQFAEIRKLLEEKNDLLKRIGEANVRLATVSAEAERHSDDAKQLKLERENLNGRLKQKDNVIAQTKSEHEKLLAEVNRVKSEYSTEKRTLLNQIETITAESTRLKAQFSNEKTSLLNQVEALNSESKRLKSQFSDEKNLLVSQVETLTVELGRLKSQFSEEKTILVNQIETLTAEAARIRLEFTNEKAALLSQVEELATELSALKSESNKVKSELEGENALLLGQVEGLTAELNRLKSEFADEKTLLLNQVQDTGLKVADLIRQRSDLISRINEQKAQVMKLHRDKGQLATQLITEQSSVKQLEKELNAGQAAMKALEERIQSETKKFEEITNSLEADIAGKSKDLAFYKDLTDGLPVSAHSRWAKGVLYRVDRIFNHKTPTPESYLLNALVFDPTYYQSVHTHLKDIIKNDPKLATKHWLERGVYEGLASSPAFHVVYYLEHNKDLKKHFKKDYHGAIKHWVDSGIREMRIGSPEFTLRTFLSKNPKIATTFANDLNGAVLYWLNLNKKKENTTSVTTQASNTSDSKKSGGGENKSSENRANNDHPKNGKDNGHLENDKKRGHLANGKNNNGASQRVAPINATRELVVDKGMSWPTKRTKMDGKRLLSQARNREHFWYHSEVIDEVLQNAHRLNPLPKEIRRLLIIAHDFRLTTGVTRPISHYLNTMTALGGHEFTSIELAPKAHARFAANHIHAHDFVIVNSIAPFFMYDGMIELINGCEPRKVAVYLHETQWVFEKLKKENPERFNQFTSILPGLNLLCVSKLQQDWLHREYGAVSTFLVRNATALTGSKHDIIEKEPDKREGLRIAMAGTVQPRKGVTLYSKVADLASANNLPWHFAWAGTQVCKDEDVYKSSNVEWLGNLNSDEMIDLLNNIDIFFLSSEDDPFPLCVLEALQAKKRVVCYSETGVSELFDDTDGGPGTVFKDYSPEAAFEALQRAASQKSTDKDFEDLNKSLSLFSFISRLNGAISEIYRSQ